MSSRSTIPSYSELRDELSGWLAGGGILTMALSPFAVPLIALTAVAVIPLLLIPLAAGLVVAVVAAPILLIRTLGRLVTRALHPRRMTKSDHFSANTPRSSIRPRGTAPTFE